MTNPSAPERRNNKTIILIVTLSLSVLLLFIAGILTGTVRIPISDIFIILSGGEASRPEWHIIVTDLRLPRAITALVAGAGLSVSGLLMQTVFRNPLAGPYVLGISAGASLGVAVVVMGLTLIPGYTAWAVGDWPVVIAAWAGSGAVLVLILLVSFRVRDIMTILILGIMFGSATGALVSVMQYFSTETMLRSFMIWTMGSLGGVTGPQLGIMVPAVVGGLLIAGASVKMLNTMLLGENYARSLGVNITAARIIIFVSTSLLAGTITAFCGPIAFIGIAVPHLARMMFRNADHAVLLPATALTGAAVLLASDIVSRLPAMEGSLPINSVTALIGIPVVIWIVIRNQKLTGIF
ncbi:MAG: iron ABC transporter permease [Marinilabiliales bacterium]|nr:MAG: iron ABC transporter permease [Marinilabiliales bacterium]